MKHVLACISESSARVVAVVLAAALVYFVAVSYQRGRDLERVCALLGPHDAGDQAVSAERRTIDAICLGQEVDDD